MKYFTAIVRILLALMFILAGFSKLTDLPAFQVYLERTMQVPTWMNGIILLILPSFELMLGLLFLAGLKLKEASAIVLVLSVFFLVFTSYELIFLSSKTVCHCMAVYTSKKFEFQGWWAALKDVCLILACGFLIKIKDENHLVMNGRI